MIVAGVWIGFSNYKNSRTRMRSRIPNFERGAES